MYVSRLAYSVVHKNRDHRNRAFSPLRALLNISSVGHLMNSVDPAFSRLKIFAFPLFGVICMSSAADWV